MGGGQLLGKGGVAIFNQDSMKTAVISPALHKQGAKTRVAFAIKTDFFKNNMSIKDYFRHQLNDGENNKWSTAPISAALAWKVYLGREQLE